MTVIRNTLKRFKLLQGTPRRFFLNVFLPNHVRKSLEQRRGQCLRCGTCCQLVWKCKFFHYDNGLPACKLYNKYRPSNCTNFPLNKADIKDRNLASPHTQCGFWWPDGKIQQR